jgi:hypothetical protein
MSHAMSDRSQRLRKEMIHSRKKKIMGGDWIKKGWDMLPRSKQWRASMKHNKGNNLNWLGMD